MYIIKELGGYKIKKKILFLILLVFLINPIFVESSDFELVLSQENTSINKGEEFPIDFYIVGDMDEEIEEAKVIVHMDRSFTLEKYFIFKEPFLPMKNTVGFALIISKERIKDWFSKNLFNTTNAEVGIDTTYPPLKLWIKANEVATNGDHKITFVFSYGDINRWHTEKESINIHINTPTEKLYNKIDSFLGNFWWIVLGIIIMGAILTVVNFFKLFKRK